MYRIINLCTFEIQGGKAVQDLVTLRQVKISEMLVKSKNILNPASIPPTPDAASLHAYRVYYQVIEWKTLSKTLINPENWGWHVENGKLEPTTMNQVSIYIGLAPLKCHITELNYTLIYTK